MREEYDFKKYFIKDEELSSVSEDKLSSKDVVKNITAIIDNTKPPFAVSVTGKSGIGKSSIINLVAENYKEKTDDYNVEKINVWKQEDSLKSILDSSFTQTVTVNAESIETKNNTTNSSVSEQKADDFDNTREVILNDYFNQSSLNDKESDKDENKEKGHVGKVFKKIGKFILTFFISFIITTIIFALMEYFANKGIYTNDIFFVENTYINYRENFWMIMLFTLGLTAIAYIVETLMISSSKSKKKDVVETNNQNDSNSQTAVNIQNEIVKTENEIKNEIIEPSNIVITKSIIDSTKTNIIIIEDVDKLPAAKMLKTLEDVKHCTDYDNCIFIVPFDEKVLAKAIEVRNQIKLSANYRPLKFEKVLDKVFQFKVHVPRIGNGDIKEYAVQLVKEKVRDFADEYCDMPILEKVVRNVLIYKNVTTPRHVKKLINNFINNRILLANRIASGKISESILEEKNINMQLAKISVIQSDFEEFYNVLFKDFDYLEQLTNIYCMDINDLRVALDNLDEELQPFMNNKYSSLMNFLVQTKNYKVDNMSILMYLTKVKSEKMYKDRTVMSFVLGEEDISELRVQEVVELVKLIDNKEDLKVFTANNFKELLAKYRENASNKVYFTGMSEVVDLTRDYIKEPDYIQYLEIVANNYNYYPEEALQLFKGLEMDIPTNIMNVLIVKINENISKENYDESFEFVKDNSNSLYEENGNISEYVHFLVDHIQLASNPTEVIEELDDNFTRIGKVYELYNNIQGLDNLDYDKAYAFIGKCIDNGDFDRAVNIINTILSDENTVENCVSIESKMENYSLNDVIECNVDDIITAEENAEGKLEVNSNVEVKTSVDKAQSAEAKFESNFQEFGDFEDFDGSDEEDSEESSAVETAEETEVSAESEEEALDPEDIKSALENASLIDGNYVLLRNLVELCAIKQESISVTDTMKFIEEALQKTNDSAYLLTVLKVLNNFDRMYFYEKRREFNEIVYRCFHISRSNEVKKNVLELTRYFKNTRLFITKLPPAEEKFYKAN